VNDACTVAPLFSVAAPVTLVNEEVVGLICTM
jgi:hypothetical protein